MNQRTKCKSEHIKLLEENIGVSLHDLGIDNGFLDIPHKKYMQQQQK